MTFQVTSLGRNVNKPNISMLLFLPPVCGNYMRSGHPSCAAFGELRLVNISKCASTSLLMNRLKKIIMQ